MALKGGKGDAIQFWDSVSKAFAGNDHVFFELYNEPHDIDADTFVKGSGTYAGALDMIDAVRKNAGDNVLVIAASDWAYDSDSLLKLD